MTLGVDTGCLYGACRRSVSNKKIVDHSVCPLSENIYVQF